MYPEILENKKKHEIDVEKLKNMFLLDEEVLKKIKINVQDTDEKILKKVYEYDAKISCGGTGVQPFVIRLQEEGISGGATGNIQPGSNGDGGEGADRMPGNGRQD